MRSAVEAMALEDRVTGWTLRLTAYLLFGAVALRALVRFSGSPALPAVGALLLAYLVLLATEEQVTARRPHYPPLYFLLQTGLIVALLAIAGHEDFFWVLFMALSLQAMLRFPPRVAYGWIGLFVVVGVASLVLWHGVAQGLTLMGAYAALALFLASYALATVRAEAAHAANRGLQAELVQASRRLDDYAAQMRQLAVGRERRRMARELHDSITQTIFSMTLTTQSALLLLDRDRAQAARQVDRLQELTEMALAEMRRLAKGPPQGAAEVGLAAALRRHLDERLVQDGLIVDLEVEGSGGLSPAEERGLFGVIQEALNNVAKHAGTSRAIVRLHLDPPSSVEVSDGGRGFEVAPATTGGRLGLASMRERAEEIGWRLSIESEPGSGTRVRAVKPRHPEAEDGD